MEEEKEKNVGNEKTESKASKRQESVKKWNKQGMRTTQGGKNKR